MNNRIALLTGATGFIGRHLVPVLQREGWKVRCAVRATKAREDEVIVGPIGPSTDWSEAVRGVQAVVHLAARVHRVSEEGEIDLYRTINTEGTLKLARCAAQAGAKRFVFVSTMLVNGSCSDGREPFRESDQIAPRGVYGASKAAAELGLFGMSAQLSMKIVIIRPPLVYGHGAAGNFGLLVRAIQSGVPLPFGLISNRRAFVGAQNLSSFIANRLSFHDSPYDVFFVADKEQVSTPEFIERIAQAMNRRAPLFPFPIRALELFLRASGRPRIRDSLVGNLEVDLSKLDETGWRPELSLDEGLARAIGKLA
ncbi:NAD-dependent epimerase/dehydratase family protein [Bradyrhizobium genosp. P]|uniref:NAD-dependent epimerase/dehydratase family protein n=1 Tax=Bradyrhizobium genosp. P TaxID=83641 RepID=UPI003CEDD98D